MLQHGYTETVGDLLMSWKILSFTIARYFNIISRKLHCFVFCNIYIFQTFIIFTTLDKDFKHQFILIVKFNKNKNLLFLNDNKYVLLIWPYVIICSLLCPAVGCYSQHQKKYNLWLNIYTCILNSIPSFIS